MTDTTPEGAADDTPLADTETAAETPVTEPEALEADDESDDDEEPLQEAKPRGKNAQARIAELTRLRHDAERERDFYKGLASQNAPPSPNGATVEPNPEDYDSDVEFMRAAARFEVQQQQATTATEREQIIRGALWEAKIEAVIEALPDFAKVVGESQLDVTNIREAIMESARGPELAYHLATNPDLAKRLNEMSPLKAALELGKLETQLTAPVKAASKAPPPANTIRTSGSSVPVDLNNAGMDAYRAERAKQGAAWAR